MFQISCFSEFLNSSTVFIKYSTITLNKSWKLWHKFATSQQKLVNNFINFKLIISNIVQIVECCLVEFLIFTESQFFLVTNSKT